MTDQSIQSEYNALFGGMGKPEVYLYGSHFLSGFLTKSRWPGCAPSWPIGPGGEESMSETEDHFAYLCEVMRYLIAGDDVTVATSRASASSLQITCSPGDDDVR